MGRLKAAVLLFGAAFAIVVLTAPGSLASTDTVKVFYQDIHDIQVDFPNGKEILSGKGLIIVTSSDIYDMERSGIMFYKCDPSGVPDRTTSITPDHYSVLEGNVVTHIFSNLTTDIEMNFTELVSLDVQQVVPGVPIEKNIVGNSILTTVVLLLSAILAAMMLVFMTAVIKIINSIPKESDVAP